MKKPNSVGVFEDNDNFNFINITGVEGFSLLINDSISSKAALFSPFSFRTFANLCPEFKSSGFF